MAEFPPHPGCLALNLELEQRFVGRFPPELVRDYFDAALNSAKLGDLDETYGDPVCCGELSASMVREDCATVSTLFTYHKYALDRGDLPVSRDERLKLGRELRASPHKFAEQHGGELRGSRQMVWLTVERDLLAALASHSNKATGSRDLLGLLHYDLEEELVMFRIPARLVENARVPTFVDGADNPVFCMWPDDTNCGFTWRLDTQERGLVEGVARPIALVSDIRPEYLGPVHTESPPPDYGKMLTRGVGSP